MCTDWLDGSGECHVFLLFTEAEVPNLFLESNACEMDVAY